MSEVNGNKRPGVFLDRDGTIIEDRGYLNDPSQVVFFSDTIPALKRLQEHFELFIVTNQSGVAKGLIAYPDVERVNAYILSHIAGHGVRIVETYVCPHERDDDCQCMKPRPYFLQKAETDYQIDLRRSYVIGDHPHDAAFAKNAGANAVYVLSGHGQKHRAELAEDVPIAAGIGEAAAVILERGK